MRKPINSLLLLVLFFVLTPITLASSAIGILALTPQKPPSVLASADEFTPAGVSIYASLPNELASISASVESVDARVEIIRQYLERYNSPLSPHAEFIVKTADNYGLDFRLITAIAQQESNLCKFIPPETYNCWGWGIHSRGTLGFTSYEEGIDTVSAGLKEKYIDKGLLTPEEIMSKYTPLSSGSWAQGVNTFLGEME